MPPTTWHGEWEPIFKIWIIIWHPNLSSGYKTSKISFSCLNNKLYLFFIITVYNDDLEDDNSDYVNDEDAEEDLDEEEQDDEGNW